MGENEKTPDFCPRGRASVQIFFASGVGLLNENFSGQGVSPEGMVTGQTDTALN